MDEEQEARRLHALFADRPVELVTFLSAQLGVLKSQAQMLLGLCGLTVTVTGFSGHHMVRGGALSTIAMMVGIVLILVAVSLTLRTMAKLRWVSQDLSDDLQQTALSTISRRNREQRSLQIAGVFVATGLAGYLVAVTLAALHNGLTD